MTRAIAPLWTDLNGRWAVPGTTYGQAILSHFDNLKAYATSKPDVMPEPEPEPIPEPPHICPDPKDSEEYKELLSEYMTLKDKLALIEPALLKLLEEIKE